MPLSAYASAARGGSVLDRIANPPQVNLLGDWKAAMDTGADLYRLRGLQAGQALGQAYQQAIDPQTGRFDPLKFNQLVASNPDAALAAQSGVESSQKLQGEQFNLNAAQRAKVNDVITSALAISDPAQRMDYLSRAGSDLITSGLVPADRVLAGFGHMPPPTDPAGQEAYLRALQSQTYSTEQKQGIAYGVPTTIPYGSGTLVTPLKPGQSINIPSGPAPGDTTKISVPMDDQGVIPQDANGVPSREPKRWQEITVPTASLPGVQRGGPQPAPTATSSSPPAPPAPNAAPLPGAYKPRPQSNAAPASTAPAPAPAPSAPATQPGAPLPRTAPPQGQPTKLEADVRAYTADQASIPDVQTSAQNLGHAYVALQQLQSALGKGAQGINDLRSFAQTLGILPQGAVTEQKLYEIINKYTERAMIDAAGGSTTDLGRHMQEQANAGTLLSSPANLEILRNDMGKRLQTIAAYKAASDKTGAGYLEHRANIADTTDPRGFVWDLYSPAEKTAINTEVAKDQTAADKLHRAIGMRKILNLQIPGLTP